MIDLSVQFIELAYDLFFVGILLVKHGSHCPELDVCLPTIFIEKDDIRKLAFEDFMGSKIDQIVPVINNLQDIITITMLFKNMLSLGVIVNIKYALQSDIWRHLEI